MVEHYHWIAGKLSGWSTIWNSGIAQWVENYGIVGYLSGWSTIWNSGITQWVEHYGILG